MIPPQLQAANEALKGLLKTRENLEGATKVLDRLEALIHVSRAERAPDVKIASVELTTLMFPGNVGVVAQITAKTGDTAQYNTRISLAPKPGFKCTCPDLKKRKQPCKHVAALAVVCRKRIWSLSDLLQTDIARLTKEMSELEALYISIPLLTRNLTAQASEALTTAIKTLDP